MDMNFRWMTQPYEDAAREAENRDRKEAIARQLGMRNAAQGAFDAGQQAFGAMQRQNDAVANALSPQGQQQFQMGMRLGYGYGLGMRVYMGPEGAKSPVGEFGWDGAAGAYALIDPFNHISIYYGQQVLGMIKSYAEIHPAVRDLVYEALEEE